jgi:hypothetical protein
MAFYRYGIKIPIHHKFTQLVMTRASFAIVLLTAIIASSLTSLTGLMFLPVPQVCCNSCIYKSSIFRCSHLPPHPSAKPPVVFAESKEHCEKWFQFMHDRA